MKTAVLMIAGEDGGGGLLPLLLPPREGDIESFEGALSRRSEGESRGRKREPRRWYAANLFTNYYCYYS